MNKINLTINKNFTSIQVFNLLKYKCMAKKITFYRNLDLKVNQIMQNQILVFYNEVRKFNNCYYARKLEVDVFIKDNTNHLFVI